MRSVKVILRQDIDTLGTTFSNATAVSGKVTVGTFTAADGSSRAFAHTVADGMIDLNTRIPADSGWVLTSATGVNSKGQIVGMGFHDGVQHPYRLTPDNPADTTPPVIRSISATPSVIWPPNGSMVPVAVSVSATDDVDPSPVCALISITATEPSTADWAITGPFSATVRAKKNTDGSAKVYSLAVTCADSSGNTSAGTVNVTVDHDPGLANTAIKGKRKANP
jgi:probable HAF family extracellular repeat protein